jgi:CubicO group peptidase (beta-lactamase class C family)
MKVNAAAEVIEATAASSRFSGVVSVTTPEEVLVRAYGYAERSNRVPNRRDTRFGTASGTKFLTALAVGVLMDRGALTLDSRVKELVSFDLPRFSDHITIEHLLTHTSGIFDYYDESLVTDFDNYYVSIPWNFLTTPRDYLPLFQHEGMKFQPGTRFSYSNGGYILLGIVIEEVTRRLYREVVKDLVLDPAGMGDSGFFALNQLPERTAVGYMELPDGTVQTNVYNLPRIGASDGGAFSTAADMEKLWHAFFADQLVSAETRKLFTTPRATIGSGVAYGRGLYMWTDRKTPTFFIVGGDAGVGFDSRHIPQAGVTITIMANRTDGEEEMRRSIHAEFEERGWFGA